MALKDKKIAPEAEARVDGGLAAALRARLSGGRLPCAAAFLVAAKHEVTRAEVGRAADALGIRLSRCQLGLFGFPGQAKRWAPGSPIPRVPEGFAAAVRKVRGPDGSVTCAALWAVAESHGLAKAAAGHFTDHLGIKIRRCQLGAF